VIDRAVGGHPGFAALLFVFMLALAPRTAHAQGEPTPFWIGDPPASDAPAPAKKKSKPARPAPPAKHKSTSAFQDDDEAAPKPKHKAVPAPKPPKATRSNPAPPASVKKKKAAPVEEDAEPLPAPKKKSRYEPLPPLPHLEPAPQGYPPATQPAPYQPPYRPPAPTTPPPLPRGSPAPTQRGPRATAPPPYQPPYSPPPQQPLVVPIDERGTATDPSSEKYKQAHPAPPPQAQPYQPRQYQPLRPDVPAPQEPIEEESATPRLRRYSLEALGGVWSKATSDAKTRDWELAYGLDFGVGFTRWLALDVRAVRSAGTDGNANVNTTTSHLLFDGRLTGAVNLGKFAVFGGAGGGLVLEKTQLFLQDVGSAPTTLSSSGLEGIAEVVIGGRWRPWKGLTMRLEVDVLLRQGALEPVFLLGAGWAF
jgi:hypothetical protein